MRFSPGRRAGITVPLAAATLAVLGTSVSAAGAAAPGPQVRPGRPALQVRPGQPADRVRPGQLGGQGQPVQPMRPGQSGQPPQGATPALVPGDPSGDPMPTAGDDNWDLVRADDFLGDTPDDTWFVYRAGRAPHYWLRSHTQVADGLLTLTTAQDPDVDGHWASGALSNRLNMTYGKFLIRSRFDAGQGTRAVADLWPHGHWPPEIDFFEIGGTDPGRTHATQTDHFAPDNSMNHTGVACDCTQWHTIGVEWTPQSIVYTMDGVVTDVVRDHVPSEPMHLALQTSVGYGKGGRPDASTPGQVRFQIDWVAMFSPRAGTNGRAVGRGMGRGMSTPTGALSTR